MSSTILDRIGGLRRWARADVIAWLERQEAKHGVSAGTGPGGHRRSLLSTGASPPKR